MKIGVYIATHNNPLWLRLAFLQLARQVTAPDVVCVVENGHADRYPSMMTRELVIDLELNEGTQIIWQHFDTKIPQPAFHLVGLRRLLDEGCEFFVKWDHDDIYYDGHIHSMLSEMQQSGADLVLQRHAACVVVNKKGDYLYKSQVDFGSMNPTGGAASTAAFNRRFAEQYAKDLQSCSGEPDDVVMARTAGNPSFKIHHVSFEPHSTWCYVSHGRNTSTSHWARGFLPKELL